MARRRTKTIDQQIAELQAKKAAIEKKDALKRQIEQAKKELRSLKK